MCRDRPQTPISIGDRGQTTQDFAVGIGIFLLALAFAFSFIPTFMTPFETPVGGGETEQADRIAATIVDDLSVADSERPNHVAGDDLEEYEDKNSSELADDTVLGSELRTTEDNGDTVAIDRVNVTLTSLDGEEVVNSTDDNYHEDLPSSSASRIVTVEDEDGDIVDGCEPACRLTVRIW
ncbi:DUF7287 family protein [Natrialbaceae archaeon AArc-T1-2]|uniref:DUF7287 family protein n=1 Tax=Natrialbaceae archaeon AArc-T1-2 TaxID=3053904 RepID=UPI00255B263F|nr:hypothetical protein [Natrialbaceae archaeon AArc-T1-2]WIV67778.1 hypothetical protein QQ977_03335 [Natrialbaceae archaeon AArc-T1-2]